MGAVLAPPPEPCGTTAKTSEWERAAPKEGGAGARLSLEESRRKEHQGSALDPGVYGRSFPLAGFGDGLPLARSRFDFLRYTKTDLGRIFEEKYAGKHFCERKIPNQGIDMGPGIVPRPPRCAPTSPKPSPWGEGAPVRTLGRMRGRSCTQPFLVEKRGAPGCRPNGSFLLPRWATRSPPHPSPSVTASPKGKPLGCAALHEKSAPNQGTYMGTVPAPLPFRCAPPRQNEQSGNERALKKGGAGALPRDSLRPGFL